MATTMKSLLALRAVDVMSPKVVTVPHRMCLHEAANLFRRADISGAPVVDDQGRCVGVLTASDFLRWAGDGSPDPEPLCPYQVKGRLLTGEEAVICTLAQGSCPLQQSQPLLGGRHSEVCMPSPGALNEWQQLNRPKLVGTAEYYMTRDVVSVTPDTPLARVARMMVDAHIHRVPVVDEDNRPVGIVSSTDLLAAVAWEEMRVACPSLPETWCGPDDSLAN